jgi:hypothetical protein
VDVLLPAEAVLLVKVGERVKGGESVLAAMGEVQMAFAAPATESELGAGVLPDTTLGEAS